MTAYLDGYNPLGWDCVFQGCYAVHGHANIEFFKPCFGGKISMTDIDATVEVRGSFLFVEFKPFGCDLKEGQKIYFEQLTRVSPKIDALCVRARLTDMEVREAQHIRGGTVGPWEPCSFDELYAWIENWAKKAKENGQSRNSFPLSSGSLPANGLSRLPDMAPCEWRPPHA